MFQYHCLNPIAEKGLGLFDEEYKKSEDLQECDAVLVRSAKMHDMELPESVKVIARAGAGVNNIPVKDCAEKGVVVFNTPVLHATCLQCLRSLAKKLHLSAKSETTCSEPSLRML